MSRMFDEYIAASAAVHQAKREKLYASVFIEMIILVFVAWVSDWFYCKMYAWSTWDWEWNRRCWLNFNINSKHLILNQHRIIYYQRLWFLVSTIRMSVNYVVSVCMYDVHFEFVIMIYQLIYLSNFRPRASSENVCLFCSVPIISLHLFYLICHLRRTPKKIVFSASSLVRLL